MAEKRGKYSQEKPKTAYELSQTTEWTYHEEPDGAKFRTRFERQSELGEHQFVVEEYDHKEKEWNPVWKSSWIGKREPSP